MKSVRTARSFVQTVISPNRLQIVAIICLLVHLYVSAELSFMLTLFKLLGEGVGK